MALFFVKTTKSCDYDTVVQCLSGRVKERGLVLVYVFSFNNFLSV